MPLAPTTVKLTSLAVSQLTTTNTSLYYNEEPNRIVIVKEILLTNTNSTEISVNIYFANKLQIVNGTPNTTALVYDTLMIQGKDTVIISLSTFLNYEASIWMSASVANKINVRVSGVLTDYTETSYIL